MVGMEGVPCGLQLFDFDSTSRHYQGVEKEQKKKKYEMIEGVLLVIR